MDRSAMAADLAHQAKKDSQAYQRLQRTRDSVRTFDIRNTGFIHKNTIAILKYLASGRAIHEVLDPKWSL